MKAYTYQIGDGVGDTLPKPAYSETLYADGLGEAIDKAKAITNLRPFHAKENTVRIIEAGADEHPVWASTAEAVRKG
jgi:hypothetical protein